MPYKDKEKRREKGLCQDCNRPNIDGKTHCALHHSKHLLGSRKYNASHKEEMKTYQFQQYKDHKEKGLCRSCSRPSIGGTTYCGLHLSLGWISSRKYKRRPEIREREKVYDKARYCKRKSENKCVGCGIPLNEESRMGVVCINCRTSSAHTNY